MPSLPEPAIDSVPQASAPAHPNQRSAWVLFAVPLIGLFCVVATKTPFRTRLVPAVLATLAFALFARLSRGVTYSGAAAGTLVTSVLFLSGGPPIFAAVLLVFVLTLAATMFGRARKRSLAIAERAGGRDGAQVLANVGVSATFAALSAITPYRLPLIVGSLAALAEVACDTVSSETGKALASKARLVTSGRIVTAGTDGAVSVPGTVLGVTAAALIAIEAAFTGLLNTHLGAIVILSATLGMLLDSLLGATLESKARITNNAVNLASTLAAALLATILTW